MKCKPLNNFPLPPSGKEGWPWTEESLQTEEAGCPKISIVIPSYNQAPYLEETIRSVLFQRYPNLEIIIIDGGSTDTSVEIIQKYKDWLTYWISEKDQGQTYAIKKGFERATGEYIAWLNSDDIFFPGMLQASAHHLAKNPETGLVFGDCNFIDSESKFIRKYPAFPYDWNYQVTRGNSVPQPTVLMRRDYYAKTGGIDSLFRFIFDYELWFRFFQISKIDYVPGVRAGYRLWEHSFTVAKPEKFYEELLRLKISMLENSSERTGRILREGILTDWSELSLHALNNKKFNTYTHFLALVRRIIPIRHWSFARRKFLGDIQSEWGKLWYMNSEYPKCLSHMFSAVINNPSLMVNRGVISVTLKATLKTLLQKYL